MEGWLAAHRACRLRPRQYQLQLRVIASSGTRVKLVPFIQTVALPREQIPTARKVRLIQWRMGDNSIGRGEEALPLNGELFGSLPECHSHSSRQEIFRPQQTASPTRSCNSHVDQLNSCYSFQSLTDGTSYLIRHSLNPHQPGSIDWNELPEDLRRNFKTPEQIAYSEIHKSNSTAEPTLTLDDLSPELRTVFEANLHPSEEGDSVRDSYTNSTCDISPSKRSSRKQQRIVERKQTRKASRERARADSHLPEGVDRRPPSGMSPNTSEQASRKSPPAQHKPLVVGRTKPKSTSISSMDSANPTTPETKPDTKAALDNEIEKNVTSNTASAAPTDEAANPPTKKKEKAPKQPKPPKAAPTVAPLSPALLDLRVGHILRAINHPNADSLYVSTIAMGDPEGTEHTQLDEETGKVVRTVCSGLNGLVPLTEMQDRKVIVVANLKPVNMRSIKSAAMVLAASPPAPPDADTHAADRVVELVNPPDGVEAGDPVFFQGWPYGEGKGPEKQLNPKKKQWEGIQPGFFTNDELAVGFDAGKSEVDGDEKGFLVVEGKGTCTVKTLKGAVVR